jgi:hypothetical protein
MIAVHRAASVCILALTACSTIPVPLELPMDVVGIVSKPLYTGWQLDHCKDEESADSPTTCINIGGEIYRVTLLDVRTLSGKRIVPKLIIGFPAHALRDDYRARMHLHLVKASESLRNGTGIEYFASEWE